MSEGMSVGIISLDLVIKEQLSKQLDKIKGEVQQAVTKPIREAGEKAGKVLDDTANSAEKAAQKVSEATRKASEQVRNEWGETAEEAKARMDKLIKEAASRKISISSEISEPKSVKLKGYSSAKDELIRQGLSDPIEKAVDKVKSQAENIKNVFKEIGEFDIPTNSVERLKRQLENTNEKIGLLQAKWQELQNSLSTADSDEAAEKIVSQINATEKQLLSLQDSAEKIEEKIAQGLGTDKLKEKFQAAAAKIKSVMGRAFNSIKSTGAKALNAIGDRLNAVRKTAGKLSEPITKFGNSIKRAAKSAFLMAGVYAAFKALKSAISEATQDNDEFSKSLNEIKANLNVAFQPIIDAIMPYLNTLMAGLAAAAKQIAAFMAELFGTTYKDALDKVKKTKELAKEAQKASTYLNSYDEMNVAQDASSNDSSDSEDKGVDYSVIDPNVKLPDWAERMKDAIKAGDWNGVGKLLAQKVNSAFDKINWKAIKKKVVSGAKSLADGLNGFTDDLDWGKLGENIGEGFNTVLLGLDTFLTAYHWDRLGSGFADLLNGSITKTDWNLLGKTIADGLNAAIDTAYSFVTVFDFSGFGSGIADSINGFFETADFAKAGKTLSEGIKGILDSGIAFLETVNWYQVGEKISTFLQNIDWSGIAKRVFRLLGAALGATVSLLWGFVKDLVDKIQKHFEDEFARMDTGSIGMDIILGILVGIGDAVIGIGQWIYDNVFKPFIEGFKNAFDIRSPSHVMEEQGTLIMAGLFGGIKKKLTALKEKAADIKEKFLKPIKEIPTYINSIFRADFSKAWAGIRLVLKSAWELMILVVKSPVNKIIDIINGMTGGVAGGFSKLLDGIESVVNSISDTMNSLSFEIPDWVPEIGGYTYGFDIPHVDLPNVDIPQIPHLAQGGLATQPTLAMVGDNPNARNDPEAILPVSKLGEMLDSGKLSEAVELLREIAGLIRSLDLTVIAKVGDKTLFTAVQQMAQEYKRRTGRSAFE